MQRFLASLALFLIAVLPIGPALAVPAPMSDADLLAKSDLVALVKVISVTCLSVSKDERTGEPLRNYSANVELIEVIKGDEPKGTDVNVTFHDLPKQIVGPWSVFYYPGEMVWTHLVKDGDAYTTTWWNGRGEVVHKAVITDLPTKPGETVAIPRVRTEQPSND
ncbi:hypothetical protein [Methyloceanibacter sp.]|uniref:hypothetical protein n=1 Tax=Methyloceanibacter sp. TaxID=1965321 RepID=UPI002D330756|nr:hypothetical protein [Methyloceanibacter sp.]HZP10616.1 hypothetical protein [Methyloceanibacter sp.]